MLRSTLVKMLVVTFAVGFCACSNTTPTTPTPTETTETFTGTLNPNGAQTFNFSVQAAGSVTLTLTSLSLAGTADTTTSVGLMLGTWNTTLMTCQVVLTNDKAFQGGFLVGASSGSGALCARIFDVGKLTANEDFTLTVTHP